MMMSFDVQKAFAMLKGDFESWEDAAQAETLLDLMKIGGACGSNIVFVPSDFRGACTTEAVFMSLRYPPRHSQIGSDQLILLSDILPKMFQMLLINSLHFHRNIYLITDQFDIDDFKQWAPHFKLVRRLGVMIHIYYVGGKSPRKVTDLVYNF